MGFQDRYGTKYIPWDGDMDPDGASGPIVAAALNSLSFRERRDLPEDIKNWLKEQEKPCNLELHAPWFRNDDCGFSQKDFNIHENEAFTMYAMECEGDMNTRLGKINNIINLMVAAGPECNNFEVQCAIYDAVGFDSDTLTDQEVNYIEKEVARRL